MPLSAFAQGYPIDTEDLFDLELEELMSIQITTASRSEETLRDAPAKVVVITRQQIQERGYINLFDLLRGEAGIDTQAQAHDSTYNRISIRGVHGVNKFIIQKDGVTISGPAGDPIPIADNLPLFNAERVEIVYGPASALYGANAFTGVVNIVTDSNGHEKAIAGTMLGQDDYYYVYGHTAQKIGDDALISLSAHFNEGSNPELSKTYPEIFNADITNLFSGAVIESNADRAPFYGTTSSHSLSLIFQLGEDFKAGYHQAAFKSPTSTAKPDFVDYRTQASWQSRVDTLFGKYQHRITDSTTTKLQMSHAFYEVDPTSKYNNVYSGYEDGYKYADSTKTEIDVQFDVDLNADSKLIWGGVFERIDALAKTADLQVPYDPDKSHTEQDLFYSGSNNTLPIKVFETSYTNLGAFAQHRHAWTDSLDTIAGIRYDDNSRYGSSVNPRLGLIFRPDNKLTTKLLYGEAFLVPAPEFAYEHFGTFTGTTDISGNYESFYFNVPNPDLEPEEMQTLEADLSYLFNKDTLLNVAAYYSRVEKLILRANMTPPDSDFIEGGVIAATSHNANVGNLKIKGLELDLSHERILKSGSLKLWGNYSHTDGEMEDKVRNLTVDLPFVAKNKIKLGLTYDHQKKYFLTPLVYWIDETSADAPPVGSSSLTSSTSRSYTLVGLNIGVRDKKRGLTINLKIDNLFNRKYYNAGLGDGLMTYVEVPQNPRQIYLGIKADF